MGKEKRDKLTNKNTGVWEIQNCFTLEDAHVNLSVCCTGKAHAYLIELTPDSTALCQMASHYSVYSVPELSKFITVIEKARKKSNLAYFYLVWLTPEVSFNTKMF